MIDAGTKLSRAESPAAYLRLKWRRLLPDRALATVLAPARAVVWEEAKGLASAPVKPLPFGLPLLRRLRRLLRLQSRPHWRTALQRRARRQTASIAPFRPCHATL